MHMTDIRLPPARSLSIIGNMNTGNGGDDGADAELSHICSGRFLLRDDPNPNDALAAPDEDRERKIAPYMMLLMHASACPSTLAVRLHQLRQDERTSSSLS
jgi:hypothetical protein